MSFINNRPDSSRWQGPGLKSKRIAPGQDDAVSSVEQVGSQKERKKKAKQSNVRGKA